MFSSPSQKEAYTRFSVDKHIFYLCQVFAGQEIQLKLMLSVVLIYYKAYTRFFQVQSDLYPDGRFPGWWDKSVTYQHKKAPLPDVENGAW